MNPPNPNGPRPGPIGPKPLLIRPTRHPPFTVRLYVAEGRTYARTLGRLTEHRTASPSGSDIHTSKPGRTMNDPISASASRSTPASGWSAPYLASQVHSGDYISPYH